MKGVEEDIIPLPSSLKLQVKRSTYLVEVYTSEETTLNPEFYGYKKVGDKFDIQIQDSKDPYYVLPKKLFQGCSCKLECGSKCSCKKTDVRGRACSRVTCKCSCDFDGKNSVSNSDTDTAEEDFNFSTSGSESSTVFDDYIEFEL